MIAIGYQGDGEILPEKYRLKTHSTRERHPLSQIAFLEEFDKGII